MSGSLSVTFNNLCTGYRYFKRGMEVLPELVLGNAGEKIGEKLRTTNGGIFTKAQAGWRALEEAGKGDFFKGLWKNFKSFIPCIKSNILTKTSAAKLAGKNTFIEGTKGFFKGLGKKMPFIASLSMIAFELPNIFKATAEQGIFQGGAEVVKATARLTGASIGAAIGSAVIPIPFVGSLVGWVAGEWLTGKIVGKTYSEQKAEKEEELKELQEQFSQSQQQAQTPQNNNTAENVNPYWLNGQNMQQTPQQAINTQQIQPQFNPSMQGNGMYNPFAAQNIPYSDDIMMQQMPFNQIA